MAVQEIEIYASVVDAAGVTYCVDGLGTNPETEMTDVSMVYLPTEEEQSNRMRVQPVFPQDENLRKAILDGRPGEEKDIKNLFGDSSFARYLLSLYCPSENDPRQRKLQLPKHEIQRVFNPQESLQVLLYEKIPEIPPETYRKLQTVVGYLMMNGIPLKDMGVYGGLQSYVVHKHSPHDIKDVDIIVYGLEYAELIHQLARTSQAWKSPGLDTRTREIDKEMRAIRHRNTRIYIPREQGLFCDVKINRKPGDTQTYTREVKPLPQITTITGVVVDASESMSSPMSIKVNVGDEIISVSSTEYEFIGTAANGDYVIVAAAPTTQPGHYLLTDASVHGVRHLAKP